MEIVFEITDGGSTDQAGNLSSKEARIEVDKLVNVNVIARAFQIGTVSNEEKKTFNQVWNDGREERLGEIVGEKIENLIPAVAELLKKYLGQVRL